MKHGEPERSRRVANESRRSTLPTPQNPDIAKLKRALQSDYAELLLDFGFPAVVTNSPVTTPGG